MELIEEFTLTGQLAEPIDIGAVPIGHRVFYPVVGGRIEGERVRGDIRSGGEWALILADGYLRVDVRVQAVTDDGAALYLQYFGLLEFNEAVQKAIATQGETAFADQHFYVNPRIETGDPRYSWLNTTFFIGEGRIAPGLGVQYRMWRPA